MSSIEIVKEKLSSEKNYHLGRVFMDCMTRNDPEGICMIDAATGEQETNASVLARSIALAKCFRRLGLKPGDVLILAGSFHLHLHIPYFAALMEGLPIAAVDPSFKYDEVKALFKTSKPKIAFCQYASFETFSRAAKDLGLDTKIVTFDEGECTLSKFMEIYSAKESSDDYQVADFDTDKIYAWLVSTSGTTGLPKLAAFKHHVVIENIIHFYALTSSTGEKTGKKLVANFSPLQWISSFSNTIHGPALNVTKLHSSRSDDIGHLVDVINKYKPYSLLTSPPTAGRILSHEKHCDMTCFAMVVVTGDKSSNDLMSNLKSRMNPRAFAVQAYGQTETGGPILVPHPTSPAGSCGGPLPHVTLQLVDPESGVVIKEPNVTGELWYKGICFTEYYNNPEETAKAFSEDGWYKTGDLFYRDENNNHFFVERLKLLIKYRNFHVTPPEIENLILTLEGVQEVCVTSVPHPEDGQLPVACVVRRPGRDVTAHQIKHLVAEKLSVHKQLRGGVVFLDEMPLTSTGKFHRSVLQKMVLTANRE